jgi:hypothetical protein
VIVVPRGGLRKWKHFLRFDRFLLLRLWCWEAVVKVVAAAEIMR